MSANSLIVKYRPDDFDQVVGNWEVVRALQDSLKTPSRAHTYLFLGPSGVGKTTLARIIAKHVGAVINEIDAASNSGVDDTRRIVEMSGFRPITGNATLFIIDECHALSKQAWQPLLKLLEEPPDYLYFALCTTEKEKVPETIKTRSYQVKLAPLKPVEIDDFLGAVAELEGMNVNGDVLSALVAAADGSPRRALSYLQAGHSATSREELRKIIAGVDADGSPEIELTQYLMKGGKDWPKIKETLGKIDNFDEAVPGITRYLANAISSANDPGNAQRYWSILEALTSSTCFDSKAKLVCMVGRTMWA